jgi:hypothetical protein
MFDLQQGRRGGVGRWSDVPHTGEFVVTSGHDLKAIGRHRDAIDRRCAATIARQLRAVGSVPSPHNVIGAATDERVAVRCKSQTVNCAFVSGDESF